MHAFQSCHHAPAVLLGMVAACMTQPHETDSHIPTSSQPYPAQTQPTWATAAYQLATCPSTSTCLYILASCMQIDLVRGMMDCLYAECKPCITDCVLAELEKLGQKYRVALKVAKVSASCSVKHSSVLCCSVLCFTKLILVLVNCLNRFWVDGGSSVVGGCGTHS